jgi:uroporphyrinogen-III decarboxylase
MEVKAGVDVRNLKAADGGQLAFMGNIEARLFQGNNMAGLEAEIRANIAPAMEGGGYIYHRDHSIPPGTRLERYTFGLNLIKELGVYS